MNLKPYFEFPYKLIDNLNIAHNNLSSVIAYWNKYQIFLCEDLKNPANVRELTFTESAIAHLIVTTKYLLCLDYAGAIYITPLKLKQQIPKRIKSSFDQLINNIIVIDFNEDIAYSLQKESNYISFCINKINLEFELCKKFIISEHFTIPTDHRNRKKIIFNVCVLSETEYTHVKGIFNSNKEWNKQILAIISFDGLTLYALLVDTNSSSLTINPIILFKSPSLINNINFMNNASIYMIVCLMSGTLIKLDLNNILQSPQNVHLNTAISKLVVVEDYFIYTDGVTLWKVENAFVEAKIVFKKFNVKNVKDFMRNGDQIICTTYSKLIYTLSIEDDMSYIVSRPTEYYPAEHLLNNCDLLNKIMKKIELNNEVIKNVKKEENYLAALALSNRHDIMDDIIQYEIIIFEQYEDILKEETNLTLSNNIEEYFQNDCAYFLLKINVTIQSKFNDILTYLIGNVTLHIIFISNKKILKTVNVKISERFKNLNIVVPLIIKNVNNDVTINLKLVTNIPGALNEKETLWAAMHNKVVIVGPEQFIKTNQARNVQFLKRPKESIKELICLTAKHHHGNLFHINKLENEAIKWLFHIQLPNNYIELFNELQFKKPFNSMRTDYLLKEFSSSRFLKSNKSILLELLNEVIEVNVTNDGFSEPYLRISSSNPVIAFHMRNFFSNLIYANFDIKHNQSFINMETFPKRLENVEKEMSSLLTEPNSTEDFLSYFKHYQNILGDLMI